MATDTRDSIDRALDRALWTEEIVLRAQAANTYPIYEGTLGAVGRAVGVQNKYALGNDTKAFKAQGFCRKLGNSRWEILNPDVFKITR